jgi:hypothetical protein
MVIKENSNTGQMERQKSTPTPDFPRQSRFLPAQDETVALRVRALPRTQGLQQLPRSFMANLFCLPRSVPMGFCALFRGNFARRRVNLTQKACTPRNANFRRRPRLPKLLSLRNQSG